MSTRIKNWLNKQVEVAMYHHHCPTCGESSHIENWERRVFGTGLELFECPNCGDLDE